jgi:hypothetical protein
MSELKPCPFCGEYPKFYGATDGSGFEAIDCINDNCHVSPTTDYMEYRDALKAWNTRAAPKVKALDFIDSKSEGCNIIYNIKKWPNSKKYRVMFNRFGGIDWLNDEFDSWYDARVGAQSHYEKLILEALE